MWQIQIYEDPSGSAPFERFVNQLDPYLQRTLYAAIQGYLQQQGPDLCKTEWCKNLKQGLYEFRIRRDLKTICRAQGVPMPPNPGPEAKVLLRIFFTTNGQSIVLLLSGYDKARSSSNKAQNNAIKQARKYLKAYKAEQTGHRK